MCGEVERGGVGGEKRERERERKRMKRKEKEMRGRQGDRLDSRREY